MIKKILLSLTAVVSLALIIGYATLIHPSYTPSGCDYTLDIAKLRELASSLPGDKPREIRVEHVTSASIPKALVSVGQPWTSVQLRVYAYQLVFGDKTIMVDTAMNFAQAKHIHMADGYDTAAWDRVLKAMSKASAIYVTHEHEDHLGGAVAVPDAPYLAKVHLNPEQLKGGTPSEPEMSPATRAALTPLPYQGMVAVAPGVVLIRAPGHTMGSQMFYVQRADGVEVLLAGDTALIAESIEFEQGPVRLASVIGKGDHHAIACQLVALNQLGKREANIAVMPGHDGARMQALVAKKVFVPGFL